MEGDALPTALEVAGREHSPEYDTNVVLAGKQSVTLGGRRETREEVMETDDRQRASRQSDSQATNRPLTVWKVVVGISLLIGVLLGVLVPALRNSADVGRRMGCCSHMKQLALALHNYYSAEGCFPPAYIADENGKPMHSWRVLILPYIDYGRLFAKYDLSQPWDSPYNSKLTHSDCFGPSSYEPFRCPSARDDPLDTNYVMIVGPDTVSNGPSSTVFGDVEDGTSMTIMLIETVDSGIHWAEPRDLSITDLQFGINAGPSVSAGSHHRVRGAHAVRISGDVVFLKEEISARVLTLLANKSDGEEATEEMREAVGW